MDKLIYQSKLRFPKRVKKLSVGIDRSIFRIADVIFDVPFGFTSGKIHEKIIFIGGACCNRCCTVV